MPGRALLVLVCTVLVLVAPGVAAADRDARHSLRAPVTGESFYFVMADRFENGTTANDDGGLGSDRLVSGFDPTHKGFYHGGDLRGLLDRIDYIQDLGTTAIWLTPSFKNKAVQLEDGPSAGYHGYWITDFTQIDPHLGTNADLRALVEAAHRRGMKVYFDIITNHTADVIDYREGKRPAYVSKDESPYRDASGRVFDDRDYAGTNRFPALDPDVSFPFTPFNPPGSENLKVPAWLNDVTLYHNRGNTTFVGENSLYGDFFGLDDLFTEHPRVVRGLTDVYKTWIRDFGVDGFRIDTMKHVNDEFWQAFAPDVLEYARRQGKREFFMFGEVFDTSRPFTSHFTTRDEVQAVIDFPFQAAAQRFAASSGPTDDLRAFFRDDDWYTDADSNVYQLPTFLGNHDMGRIGHFVRQANPGADDAELVARLRLAHALMYFSRGNPVVYYGDEQGFAGLGGDQSARQDMFPSRVAEYNADDLIGTDATTAVSNFDRRHPLYRSIAALARTAERHPALRDGAHQHRWSSDGPGIYAFSRIDRREQREYVVALNNAEAERTAAVPTYLERAGFERVHGDGERRLRSDRGGRLELTVPALGAVVYRAERRLPRSRRAPAIALDLPAGPHRDRVEVGADVDGDSFYEVTFLARGDRGRGGWRPIGTDDTAPYRVFHDIADRRPGSRVEYRAVVLDNSGNTRRSGARGLRVRRAGGRDPDARRGRPRARSRRRHRVGRPGVGRRRRALRAPRRRRRVDGHRDRQLVAVAVHGLRRRLGARRARGHADQLPGDAERAHHQRRPHGADGPAAGHDRDRALPAPGRRLRRSGACTCGATRSPTASRPTGTRHASGPAPTRSARCTRSRSRTTRRRSTSSCTCPGATTCRPAASRAATALRAARPPADLARAGRPDRLHGAAALSLGH